MKKLGLIGMKFNRRYLLVLCLVIGGSLAVAFVAGGSRPWPFRDVTAAGPASEGLEITPLSTPSKAQALQAASTAAKFGGRPAEKVVYAHGSTPPKCRRLNQDCLFVDPATGKIIEGTEGQVGG